MKTDASSIDTDMNGPAISVVICTHNRAAFVGSAIDSVLGQAYQAAEIIVVDDGSTDETQNVLKKYAGKVHIVQQSNQGVSAARNAGIQLARSEWVAFLDDDDEYKPDRLAIAAESIQLHPDSKIHVSNIAIVSENSPSMDLFELRNLKVGVFTILERPLEWIFCGCFYVQSLVVKKEALHQIGSFRNVFYEDMDLFLRLSAYAPWIADNRQTINLIRREDSGSNLSTRWRSRPVERCKALIKIYEEALNSPKLNAREHNLIKRGLGTYWYELGVTQIQGDAPAEARSSFMKAGRHFPRLHSKLKAYGAAAGGRFFLKLLGLFLSREQGVRRSEN